MSKEKYIDALASISLFKSLTREELAWGYVKNLV